MRYGGEWLEKEGVVKGEEKEVKKMSYGGECDGKNGLKVKGGEREEDESTAGEVIERR